MAATVLSVGSRLSLRLDRQPQHGRCRRPCQRCRPLQCFRCGHHLHRRRAVDQGRPLSPARLVARCLYLCPGPRHWFYLCGHGQGERLRLFRVLYFVLRPTEPFSQVLTGLSWVAAIAIWPVLCSLSPSEMCDACWLIPVLAKWVISFSDWPWAHPQL